MSPVARHLASTHDAARTLPPEIAAQVSRALATLQECLGERIVAVHLFGSALDGGLKPFSDIDLLVTLREALPDPARRPLMQQLLELSGNPGGAAGRRALEVTVVVLGEVVPARHPARRELQFGEWLRADLEAGTVEPAMPDPDLTILLAKARAHSLALLGPAADQLFDEVANADLAQALADTLAQWQADTDWAGDERNVVLALARIAYTATTGGIAPKDMAASWLLERLPRQHHFVLNGARLAYLGESADALGSHPDRVGAFVRFAKGFCSEALMRSRA